MAVDPRLECLPENEGKAAVMWGLILQTTMGQVMKPASSVNRSPPIKPFQAGEDYISLTTDSVNNNLDLGEKYSEKNYKRKKSVCSSSDSSEDEDDKLNFAPWKKCEKYLENVTG